MVDVHILCTLFSAEHIENLDGCLGLKYLDVSNNLISKIDNLSSLQSLESLIIKGYRLSKADSIKSIVHLNKLRELDLSKNKINCTLEKIIEVLSKCKSLRILSLKGNPIAKSTKHYRKLVVSRCKRLTHLDGKPICSEERRRCKIWGDVVQKGGSYDEADAAALVELNQIKSEVCEVNAERNALRRSMHGSRSSDGSTSSGKSSSIGATVVDGIKKTFGLVDSRAPSSSISWSSKRNMDESMRRELDEARGIVESQRKEIVSLKGQLEEKQSKENVEPTQVHMIDLGEDSERETSYSLLKNQQLAQNANVKVAADTQHSPLRAVQAPDTRSSSMSSYPGVDDFDPFSIMPPIPPRNTT